MAIINFVGWETGDSIEAYFTSGTFSVQGTTKRSGNWALRTNPATTAVGLHWIGRPLAASGVKGGINLATCYYTFYFLYLTKPADADTHEPLAVIRGTAQPKLQLHLNNNGTISAYDSAYSAPPSDLPNLLATGTKVLSLNTQYRISIMCGTGTEAPWAVLIDGVLEISGTGNVGGGQYYIELGKGQNFHDQTVDFYYDDLCIDSEGYPEPGRVIRMDPAGDSATYTAWVATGDTPDYECVDEGAHAPPVAPDGDTTYLSSATSGEASAVTLETSSAAGVTDKPRSVKACAIVNEPSGGTSAIAAFLKSGATEDYTTDTNPSNATYLLKARVYTTDPATSIGWGTTPLDALEVGVKINASNAVRCTYLALMVWCGTLPIRETAAVTDSVVVVTPDKTATDATTITESIAIVHVGEWDFSDPITATESVEIFNFLGLADTGAVTEVISIRSFSEPIVVTESLSIRVSFGLSDSLATTENVRASPYRWVDAVGTFGEGFFASRAQRYLHQYLTARYVIATPNVTGELLLKIWKSGDNGQTWSVAGGTGPRYTTGSGEVYAASSALGPDGVIHFLWGDNVEDKLYYCTYDTQNAAWGTKEQVTTFAPGPGYSDCHIALDAAGKPHIVYTELSGSYIGVYYRNKVSGSWSAAEEVYLPPADNVLACKVELDQNDAVHVVYQCFSDPGIYWRKKSGTWGTAENASWFFTPTQGLLLFSLVLNSSAQPVVAYRSSSNLVLARRTGVDTWTRFFSADKSNVQSVNLGVWSDNYYVVCCVYPGAEGPWDLWCISSDGSSFGTWHQLEGHENLRHSPELNAPRPQCPTVCWGRFEAPSTWGRVEYASWVEGFDPLATDDIIWSYLVWYQVPYGRFVADTAAISDSIAVVDLGLKLLSDSITASDAIVAGRLLTIPDSIVSSEKFWPHIQQTPVVTTDTATELFKRAPRALHEHVLNGLYAFVQAGNVALASLRCYRSADGGITWVRQDSGNEPSGYMRDWDTVIDRNGVVHLCWSAGNFVKYKTFDTCTNLWGSTENVSATELNESYNAAAIAADSGNKPHVVYWDTVDFTATLRYRNRISGSWSAAENVATDAFPAAIELDLSGNAHVVWKKATAPLGYRKRSSGGSWDTEETCVASADTPDAIHLLVDPDGYPCVVVRDASGYVRFSKRTTSWSDQTLSYQTPADHLDLFASKGLYAILFKKSDHKLYMGASSNGTTWDSELMLDNSPGYEANAQANTPRACKGLYDRPSRWCSYAFIHECTSPAGYDVHYAALGIGSGLIDLGVLDSVAVAEQLGNVPITEFVTCTDSVAVEGPRYVEDLVAAQDLIVLTVALPLGDSASCGETISIVRSVYLTDSGFVSETILESARASLADTVAVTDAVVPFITFDNKTVSDPVTVSEAIVTWATLVTDAAVLGEVPWAMAWRFMTTVNAVEGYRNSGGRRYHFKYGSTLYMLCDSPSSFCMYRSTDGGSTWTASTSNPAGGDYFDGVQDSSGIIHILYKQLEGDGDDLKYLTYNCGNNTWGTPEVIETSVPQGPACTSMHFTPMCGITVDTSDKPHIVYCRKPGSYQSIYYRNRVSGTWSAEEEVYGATQSVEAYQPAIEIDSSGNFHVVFRTPLTGNPQNIKYRKRTSGSWDAVEQVCECDGGSTSNALASPMLTMQSIGQPIISTVSGYGVRIATRTGTDTWSVDSPSWGCYESEQDVVVWDSVVYVIWSVSIGGHLEHAINRKVGGAWKGWILVDPVVTFPPSYLGGEVKSRCARFRKGPNEPAPLVSGEPEYGYWGETDITDPILYSYPFNWGVNDKSLTDFVAVTDAVERPTVVADIGAVADSVITTAALEISDSYGAAETMAITASTSVADPGVISDSATLVVAVTVADLVTIVDVLSTAAAIVVSDATTSADSVAITVGATVADAATLSDTLEIRGALSISEAFSVLDTVGIAAAFGRSDSFAETEAFAVVASLSSLDAIIGAEAIVLRAAVSVSETITSIDALVTAAAAALSDTVTIADTVAIAVTQLLADTIVETETIVLGVAVPAADAVTSVEALVTHAAVIVTDAVAAIDDAWSQGGGDVTLYEMFVVAEALYKPERVIDDIFTETEALALIVGALITESIAAADTAFVAARAVVNDISTVGDTVVLIVTVVTTDASACSETITVTTSTSLSEALATTDTVAVTTRVVTTDSVAATDALVASVALELAEAVSTTDEVLKEEQLYQKTADDVATISDVVAVACALAVPDTLSTTDALELLRGVLITESLGLTEALEARAQLALPDAALLTDTAGLAAAFVLTDGSSVQETLAATATVSVVDAASTLDSISASGWIALGDTVAVSEEFLLRVTVSLPDALSVVDEATSQGGGDVTLYETFIVAEELYKPERVVDEVLASTEVVDLSVIVPLGDAVSITEAFVTTASVSLLDSVAPSEATIVTAALQVSDTCSAVDAVEMRRDVTVAEGITTTESIALSGTVSVNELAAIAEELTPLGVFSVSDTFVASETTATGATLEAYDVVAAAETIVLSALADLTDIVIVGDSIITAGIQIARPDSDVALGSWTDQDGGTTNIWQTIDEILANDADYIKSSVDPSADTYECGLTNVEDPTIHTDHGVSYRYKKSITSGQIDLVVKLLQGSTEIASWSHLNIGDGLLTAEQELTEEQAAVITDYTDLRIRFVASKV